MAMLEEELTREIISGFFEVYNTLGYGFLEKAYANALVLELRGRGLSVAREVGVAVVYKKATVGRYLADIIVEGKVLVEVKAKEALSIADHRQTRNYQRATNIPIALLFNFGPDPKFHRTISSRKSASSASSACKVTES